VLDLNRYKELGQRKYTHNEKKPVEKRKQLATKYEKSVGEEF
jgi:hypothetical protein